MVEFYPTISYGELCKYATGVQRALLPASSWAGAELRRYHRVRAIPAPSIPEGMTEIAADCGGFVATRKWGEYKYSPQQYIDWLQKWRVPPYWAATMDYCCEDEITSGKPGVVRERQQKTTEFAYHFWEHYKTAPWVWVPTIQGWSIVDYKRHATELFSLITEMQTHYGSGVFRVGIGTLCRRASPALIREIVQTVSGILPTIPLHLWGVKLGVAQSSVRLPDEVLSIDSGAWNGMWGSGREEWKQSPYSQREWCFKVALPRYTERVYTSFARVS